MKTEAFEYGFGTEAFWETLRFLCRLVKTGAIENGDEKKAPYNAISVSVLGTFRVDNRRKRIKKYAFSNGNESVWRGESNTRMPLWWKYFISFLRNGNLEFWKRIGGVGALVEIS